MLMDNLNAYGFEGDVRLVHPRGGEAFGRPVAKSCAELDGLDLAIIVVSAARVPTAMREAKAAGAVGAVVLAAGYGEAGKQGHKDEEALIALSRELDLPFLGPNGLGFCNLVNRSVAWLGPIPRPVIRGSIALISQSGNMASTAGSLAARQGIGLSHVVSTGNESVISLSDVAGCLVEDPDVKVVAIFAESIADPAMFLTVARRAAELQKPIVVLKIGRSRLAQRLAQTHTGALVGNDRLIDAAFRSTGVIRVDSLEQLVASSGLLAATGVLRAGGLGVVSTSGGTNDVIADHADAAGVDLPLLSPETVNALDSLDLPFAASQNPFDVTGLGVRNPEVWRKSVDAMLADPGIALVAAAGFQQIAHASDLTGLGVDVERFRWIASTLGDQRRRGLILLNTLQDISDHQRDLLSSIDAPHVLPGLQHGLDAIADVFDWSTWIRRHAERPPTSCAAVEVPFGASGSWWELPALRLFETHGIPVAPTELVTSAEAAVATAARIAGPVVVKVAAPTLTHKSDIGGVVLGVVTASEVAAAFNTVTATASAAGHVPEGAVIAPMRPLGVDLLLGTVRTDDWGTFLVIGMGGTEAEAFEDQATRLLPISVEEAREMLEKLPGGRLLTAPRTGDPADLDAVATVVHSFAELAYGLGSALLSAEINPLRVRGRQIEALDGLVEWSGQK
jgi:acyl-CoA synthetase (NDP forming)